MVVGVYRREKNETNKEMAEPGFFKIYFIKCQIHSFAQNIKMHGLIIWLSFRWNVLKKR